MTTPSRFSTSLQLLRTTLRIIKRNPKLLLFPLVNAAVVIVIMLFYVPWPLILDLINSWNTTGHGDQFGDIIGRYLTPSGYYLYLASLYLMSMFVVTFMNVAFYHEIFAALAGEAVSIRGGLHFARQRLRSIFLWSLFASSVGMLLRVLADRMSLVGGIAARLGGLAFSVAAIFVIPAIIRDEKASPLTLLRNSALTLKKTWGESILGYAGISGVEFVVFLSLLAPCLLGAYGISVISDQPMFFVAIPFLLLDVIASAYLMSIANSVYRCSLYVYASEGTVPEPFTPAMMDAAWKVKKS